MSHQEEPSQGLLGSPSSTTKSTVACNPLYLLLITATTIFTTEVLIMILLWKLPPLQPMPQAFVDASLLLLFVFPNLYFFVFKPLRCQIEKRQLIENEKDFLIYELRQALDEVKALQGIIPICASCKKIRDDKGYWHQVEAYVTTHSKASFSHGICPDCFKELYPEISLSKEMN